MAVFGMAAMSHAALPPLVYVGKVASDSELPSCPRIGWTFVAEADGMYAGFALKAGDAVVCLGMAPAEWTALAGPVAYSGAAGANSPRCWCARS